MESTWRRTLSSVFIFLTLSDVFSQKLVQAGPISFPGNMVKDVNNECSGGNSRSPSSQLMNTLFTLAAANGVLPELLPAFRTTSILQEDRRNPNFLLEEQRQQTPFVDVPIVNSPYSQGPVFPPVFQRPEIPPGFQTPEIPPIFHRPEIPPVCLKPELPQFCQKPDILSPPPPFQVVSGTYLPPGLSPTMIPSLTISHDINQIPILPPPSPPAVPLQAYSFSQPGIGFPRPLPLLHPQPILDDGFPTVTPVFPDLNPGYQITTIPAVEVPIEIDECSSENLINDFGPIVVRDDYGQLPITLQINMPAQNTPAPRVTVITAPPSPAPAPPSEYIPSDFMYPPPMPPIIMEGSRSKMKHWLPIIMIALLNDGCQGGGGNRPCGCCCPCNCGNSNIPIPYPIPIPTNNPIVNSSRPRSRLCRRRDDGPMDDDN